MERTTIITFLPLLFFGSALSAVLPVERCLTTDKACLISSAQKIISAMVPGIPEYGIEVLDPLAMDYVEFNASGLLFTLSDAKMEGIKGIIFDDYNWDLKNKVWSFTFHTDVLLKGHYKAKGKVLNFPISGDGEITIKLKNMECKAAFDFKVKKKDNIDYVKVTKYEYTYDVKDNANYQLTNLFDGDKELSDAAMKLANQNWKPLANMFGRPLIDVVVVKQMKNFNNLFHYHALNEYLIYDSI